jgi:hypothetical protein
MRRFAFLVNLYFYNIPSFPTAPFALQRLDFAAASAGRRTIAKRHRTWQAIYVNGANDLTRLRPYGSVLRFRMVIDVRKFGAGR